MHNVESKIDLKTVIPNWMYGAIQASHTLHPITRNKARYFLKSSNLAMNYKARRVYAVLLYNPAQQDSFGVYVGMTFQMPLDRFKEHKRNYKAGKGYVRDFGVRLLPDLYRHLNPMLYREAQEIERELYSVLSTVVPWVRGGH